MDVTVIMLQLRNDIVPLNFLVMNLREKWIRKIPNKDLKATKYSYVCKKHFTADDISRYHIAGDLKVSDLFTSTFIIIIRYNYYYKFAIHYYYSS